MPIFQKAFINIRHLLGMYITKQAKRQIYLIAQKTLQKKIKYKLNFPSSPWVPFPI